MSDLKGKVAVVTGASKGIGAGIAKALAKAGAAVVVNYASSRDGADRVVADIEANGGRALAVKGDVTKEKDVRHLMDATEKSFGAINVLVNNAGVYKFRPLEDVTEDDFHRHFNVNVLGTLLRDPGSCKAFRGERGQRHQYWLNRERGRDRDGIGLFGDQGRDRYDDTRACHGTWVTQYPGQRDRSWRDRDRRPAYGGRRSMIARTALGRLGQPDDIARIAVFLASDNSAWITGERLAAAGGYH